MAEKMLVPGVWVGVAGVGWVFSMFKDRFKPINMTKCTVYTQSG